MTLNGGDPRTYKKIRDDGNNVNHQHGLSSSSNTGNISNTNVFTNQTNSSTSYNYSSSDITDKTDSFNRSSNDRGKSTC